MSRISDTIIKSIASNLLTSQSMLSELSSHPNPDVRFLIAGNSSTPVNILSELGQEFPDTIIDNPIFRSLMIEEPNSRFVRLSLARSSKTASEILAELAATEKDDETICCAIARNPITPIVALKSLFGWRATEDDGDYPYINVTREVINNPTLSVSILEELLDRYIDVGWHEVL